MNISNILGLSLKDPSVSQLLPSKAENSILESYNGFYYCNFYAYGISLLCEEANNRISSIFLYSDGYHGFNEFKGTLPKGLSFSSSRLSVSQMLGQPSKSGGGKFDEEFKLIVNPWDLYDYGGYRINVTYNTLGKTALVCVSGSPIH